MNYEHKKIKRLFLKLQNIKPSPFPDRYGKLNAPKEHGVYIIYGTRNSVLHVGRSIRGQQKLFQRLKNHLAKKSTFMRNYRKISKTALRKNCRYSYILIKNERKRALVEHLAVGKLCPKYLGLGKKKKYNSSLRGA